MKTYLSYLKWFIKIILLGVMVITSFVGYLIAYPLRHWLKEFFKPSPINFYISVISLLIGILFSILIEISFLLIIPIFLFQMSYYYLDNNYLEDLSLTPFKRFLKSYKDNVINNPVQNSYDILKPLKGIKVLISFSGYLSQAGIPVSVLNFGTLKELNKDGDIVKNGKFMSYSHSIFGKSYSEYDINGKRYWRYSYCKYNKLLKCFIQLQLGYSDNEIICNFKIRKGKLIR